MLGIRHHEFWNTHLFHFPIYCYWLWLSLKARSPFFFSAANPAIENGGLIGESKYKILQRIDPQWVPKTLFYETAPSANQVKADLDANDIEFPFVVKPDVGQGGWMIDRVYDKEELENFLAVIKMPFMIQEFVDQPVELGVLYYRYPGEQHGRITSIARKELLTVVGDGSRAIRELLMAHPRARNGHVKKLLRLNRRMAMDRVPDLSEKVELSFIGNHSYGTTFVNAAELITPELQELFDHICSPIKGFYFGRFDLRSQSVEDFRVGRFKVLELNGVGSEPLHIFDPRESAWKAYAASFRHWDIIYRISRRNRNTCRYLRWREALQTLRQVFRMQRLHGSTMVIGN